MRHRRDNSRIRRAEPRVNPHADACRRMPTHADACRRMPTMCMPTMRDEQSGGVVSGHHVRASSWAARRRRQGPQAPRNAGGGAERSALDGAEHSAMLSDVMAGRLALRKPIPKPVDVAFRKPCDDVETMRRGTRCRVVDEESVNCDQNARHMRALPLC